MKALSFFAGAGGMDLGLHRAGFNVLMSIEIEELYCETLKINNPSFNVLNGDIKDFNKLNIYNRLGLKSNDELDLIFGGSPCQSFSTAGKRQAFADSRGEAMLEFADIVSELQPKTFLLENVKGLLSAALEHRPLDERGPEFPPLKPSEMKGSAFNYLLSRFKNYSIEFKLINSAEYGVPQKRERVFIIGVRNDLNKVFKFPETTHDKKGENGKKKFKAFSDVMKQLEGIEHRYSKYSEARLKYMKMIPKGGGCWRDLPENLIKEAMGGAYSSGGGKTGYFRRIKVNEPSPTLLTSPIQKSTNLGHPYEDRPLSIEEYLEIQGFPKEYRVLGSIEKQYVQIGNAVPIKVAEILGRELIRLVR